MDDLQLQRIGTGPFPDNILPTAIDPLRGVRRGDIYPLIARTSKTGPLVTAPIDFEDIQQLNFSFDKGSDLPDLLDVKQSKSDKKGAYDAKSDAQDNVANLARSVARAAPPDDDNDEFDVIANSLLGPPLPFGSPLFRSLPTNRNATPSEDGPRKSYAGIIDTGIAFWNTAFQQDGASIVKTVTFLRYLEDDATLETLETAPISLPADGDDSAIRMGLGIEYPHSVYGAFRGGPPLFRSAAFSHGTAMLDLMTRDLRANGETLPPIFAAELPAEVLADSNGFLLETILELAITTLADQMLDADPDFTGTRDGVILLPYAFLGGPHDGSRSIIGKVDQLIDTYRIAGLNIELVVPMGNHLDDRVRVELRDGAQQSVGWRLFPDDASSNTLEMIHAQPFVDASLSMPNGATLFLGVPAGLYGIVWGGNLIGLVHNVAISGGHRTRVTLAPTTGPGALAPFGRWELRNTGNAPVQAWLLRDDATVASRATARRRPSIFEDHRYRAIDSTPDPVSDDTANTSVITRAGTASVLSTSGSGKITPVASRWSRGDGSATLHAVYSGRLDGTKPIEAIDVDAPRPLSGVTVLGNGSARLFKATGTSVASALYVNQLLKVPANEPGGGTVLSG